MRSHDHYSKPRRRWSAADERILKTLTKKGESWNVIAKTLGRTAAACQNRAGKEGLLRKGAVGPRPLPFTTRTCAFCGQEFTVKTRRPVSPQERRWKNLQGMKPPRPEKRFCTSLCANRGKHRA